MKNKITVIGSSNTDLVVNVPQIPKPGETVLGSGFKIVSGGKGANQAVAASRAGASVIFITCVSNDSFGMQAIEGYNKEGIDTSSIKVIEGTHSGMALINVSDGGENSISVAPGANRCLLPDDIYKNKSAFQGSKIVLAQLEIPMDTVKAANLISKELNIPFMLNPAPGFVIPESILQQTDIITPNETEIEIITSCVGKSKKSLAEMSAILHKLGVKNVIVTLGKKGVYLSNSDFKGILPGYPVDAVDTTAAGDVFNGVLGNAIASGIDIQNAIDLAQKAASISVTKHGAQPSAPTLPEIHNKFKN